MPAHREMRFSPHAAHALYAMVMDIEKYPEFLPWCRAARIIERHEMHCLAELIIHFKHMTERYTSNVRGLSDQPIPEIQVDMVKGPFEYLINHWRFEPVEGGTNIHFHVDFRFKSRILESLIGGIFGRATEKMTQAFITRADSLYDKKN